MHTSLANHNMNNAQKYVTFGIIAPKKLKKEWMQHARLEERVSGYTPRDAGSDS
jgi:hypothetical protein